MVLNIFRIFFFFSSRRRHTRYWRDWSSDVCSSDLPTRRPATRWARGCGTSWRSTSLAGGAPSTSPSSPRGPPSSSASGDRKSGGEGKRVDLGGPRIIKKKKKTHLESTLQLVDTKEH